MGSVVAILGFAFAFTSGDKQYVGRFNYYMEHYGINILEMLLRTYPYFVTGIIIGVGGIVIVVIGNHFFKETKPLEKICVNCGQTINASSKHCPECGFMQPIQSS